MPRETITMYKGDSRAPGGRVSFGDGKTAAEWQEEMETQGFIYTPEEKRFVKDAIAAVMRGERTSNHHQVITEED